MNDARSFAELTPEEKAKLQAITDIKDFEARFIRTSMKDGLPCVAISINGIEMTVYDLDTDEAASWMNPSFNDAKRSILKRLRQLAGVGVGANLDDKDEFEKDVDDDYYGDSYGDEGSY